MNSIFNLTSVDVLDAADASLQGKRDPLREAARAAEIIERAEKARAAQAWVEDFSARYEQQLLAALRTADRNEAYEVAAQYRALDMMRGMFKSDLRREDTLLRQEHEGA